MSMTTELILHYATPTQNQMNKLHWAKRHKLRESLTWEIRAKTRNRHTGPVRLEVYRFSVGIADYDNIVAGFKPVLDALVNASIIPDDNPDVIIQRHYEGIRVARRDMQHTLIRIIDIDLNGLQGISSIENQTGR